MTKRVLTNDDIRNAYDRAHDAYRNGQPYTGLRLWKIAKRMEERLNDQAYNKA